MFRRRPALSHHRVGGILVTGLVLAVAVLFGVIGSGSAPSTVDRLAGGVARGGPLSATIVEVAVLPVGGAAGVVDDRRADATRHLAVVLAAVAVLGASLVVQAVADAARLRRLNPVVLRTAGRSPPHPRA